MNRPLVALLAAAGAAAAAHAQVTYTPLVTGGDTYNGIAIVNSISAVENMQVNNSGAWLLNATGAGSVSMIIRGQGANLPGTVYMSEGQATGAPAGGTVLSFDSVRLNNNGNSSYNIFFSGLPSDADSGVVFNTSVVVQEGDMATASALSAGTPYISNWIETYINDQDQILMIAAFDDPNIEGTTDRAAIRIDKPGGAATQTVLVKEGDEVVPERVLGDVFGTGPHNHAFAGNYAVITGRLTGDTSDDGVIMLHDGTSVTVIAREGGAVPAVPDRTWASSSIGGFTSNTAVDVNSSGQWVLRAQLNAPLADDSIIVKNGTEVIAREGHPVPENLGPYNFTGLGNGPVHIDNQGNVYFFASWNDPDTSRNVGLFRNDQLIAQKWQTFTTTEEWVSDISAGQSTIAVSDNGRYVIFEGTLTHAFTGQTRQGAILIDLGEPPCAADFNNSGGVTVQDIFDFLAAYFSNSPSADFNGVGGVTVQDIFDYLAAYFTGC